MAKRTKNSGNKMWGGRFASAPDAIMQKINASIDFDWHLYRQDIAASKAHAEMLAKQGIIGADDARKIIHGLDTILSEIGSGKFKFKRELEDIHMNVESRLAELIGPAAGRLHTARSRNDQVATDFRLWVRDRIDDIYALLGDYQQALAEKALKHADVVMPGFTHLQTAQPVTFGHHLLAYVEMAARDRGRFADAQSRLNDSPLGAAALAGTSFPIDREMTADALDFAAARCGGISGDLRTKLLKAYETLDAYADVKPTLAALKRGSSGERAARASTNNVRTWPSCKRNSPARVASASQPARRIASAVCTRCSIWLKSASGSLSSTMVSRAFFTTAKVMGSAAREYFELADKAAAAPPKVDFSQPAKKP